MSKWYRLSLNSAVLRPCLSMTDQALSLEVWHLKSLQISLTAAAQILFSLSTYGADYVWTLESQTATTFPAGKFHLNEYSLARLYYTVDSTWISLAFALTFLVMCYLRGLIDGMSHSCLTANTR